MRHQRLQILALSEIRERTVLVLTARLQDTVDRCYKIHGYPPGYKTRDNHHTAEHTKSQPLTLILQTIQVTPTLNQWPLMLTVWVLLNTEHSWPSWPIIQIPTLTHLFLQLAIASSLANHSCHGRQRSKPLSLVWSQISHYGFHCCWNYLASTITPWVSDNSFHSSPAILR